MTAQRRRRRRSTKGHVCNLGIRRTILTTPVGAALVHVAAATIRAGLLVGKTCAAAETDAATRAAMHVREEALAAAPFAGMGAVAETAKAGTPVMMAAGVGASTCAGAPRASAAEEVRLHAEAIHVVRAGRQLAELRLAGIKTTGEAEAATIRVAGGEMVFLINANATAFVIHVSQRKYS